jgi:uncharacterized membrane protein
VTIHSVRLRDMTIDDLVSWGWSLALASTGIVFVYWVDVLVGAVLLLVGLTGMHVVRLRFRRRAAVLAHASSSAATSTTSASSSSDWQVPSQ